MAAVSAPTGAISPCTDAAIDSIRRRLLPVLTSWLMICAMWRGDGMAAVDAACPSVDRSLVSCIATYM